MPKDITEVETDEILAVIISSEGDLCLAAERLDKRLEFEYGTTKEYHIVERLAQFDTQITDALSAKLRALLSIRLFHLISLATNQLQASLCDLRPSELARTHASLVNSYSTLTAPAAKITFDFDSEIAKLSNEFGMPADEVRAEIKNMENKIKNPLKS